MPIESLPVKESPPVNLSMRLPPAQAVARMFGELIGREVQAKVVSANSGASGTQIAAAYIGECQSLQIVIHCDLALGGSLGAALMVVPVARVNECIKAKCLDEDLAANLYEVFNVLAAVFPQNGAPRIILHGLHCGADIPAEVRAVLANPRGRLDLEINVAGYLSGRLAILVRGL